IAGTESAQRRPLLDRGMARRWRREEATPAEHPASSPIGLPKLVKARVLHPVHFLPPRTEEARGFAKPRRSHIASGRVCGVASLVPSRPGAPSLAPSRASIARRLERVDWTAVERSLDDRGHALIPALLTTAECRALVALDPDDRRFRSRIDMERFGFGVGRYGYFARPPAGPRRGAAAAARSTRSVRRRSRTAPCRCASGIGGRRDRARRARGT